MLGLPNLYGYNHSYNHEYMYVIVKRKEKNRYVIDICHPMFIKYKICSYMFYETNIFK